MFLDSQTYKIRVERLAYDLLAGVWDSVKIITSDAMGLAGFILTSIFLLLAFGGPWITPYGPFDTIYLQGAEVARYHTPSLQYLFGTNNEAQDVFSQVIYGVRYAVLIGFASAIGSALIGTIIGLISGYYGGVIDHITARLTDVAFGIPELPFALILVAIMGPSVINIIIVIIFFLWRTTARVIRSQVLTLKERPFVLAAKIAGAGDLRILLIHIAPNVLPLIFLSMALNASIGVMMEAGLSFVGFGDPFVMTWGQMLHGAFRAGAMRDAWWWVLPPGVGLSLFITGIYLITRAYEEKVNPRLRMY